MISYEKTDMNHGTFPVFDGHNDVLTRLWLSDHNNPAQAFIQEGLAGHLDLKRCQTSRFCWWYVCYFLAAFSLC